MAELAFEAIALALEATRGTAIAAPTHLLPLSGSVTPNQDEYRPDESWGILAEYTRSAAVKRWVEWSADGGLDPNYAPLLFNMLVKGGVTSPTTPSGATSAKLWTFAPSMTADNIKTATIWFGDPNTQVFKAAYGYADSFSVSADATGSDGVTMQMGGAAQYWSKVSAPTYPSMTPGSLLIPGSMQVWLDGASDPIGTTEIVGRVASIDFSVDSNISRKHFNTNPSPTSAIPTFSRIGRGKRHAELTVNFDFADTAQFDLFETNEVCKLRVRLNGNFIETTSTPEDLYEYVQFDVYGTLGSPSWTEIANTNRGFQIVVMSQYNSTAATDWSVAVQNTKSSL